MESKSETTITQTPMGETPMGETPMGETSISETMEYPTQNTIKFEINSSENKKFYATLTLDGDEINFYIYTNQIPKKEYEKSFNKDDFYCERYFRMFENIEEIFYQLNDLIKKVPYFIGEETSKIFLIFELNIVKITEVTFILEEKQREQKDINNEIYDIIFDNKNDIIKMKENYDKEINNLKNIINNLQKENNDLKSILNYLTIENEKNKNDILNLKAMNIINIDEEIKINEKNNNENNNIEKNNNENNIIKNNNNENNNIKNNNNENNNNENNKNENNNNENNNNENNNNEINIIKNNNNENNNNEDDKIIFDNLTIKEYNSLKNWILSTNNQNKDCNFEILFDSNVPSKDFHELCDNQTNTLTLIETKNNFKFGGFTESAWSSNKEEKKDNNSFLFSLDKNKKYIKKDKEKSSIYCNPDYGPFFGSYDKNDIVVKGNIKNGSVKKNGSFLDEELFKEINGGKSNFIIKNLKVFKISFT